jgi:hypothetical protein
MRYMTRGLCVCDTAKQGWFSGAFCALVVFQASVQHTMMPGLLALLLLLLQCQQRK